MPSRWTLRLAVPAVAALLLTAWWAVPRTSGTHAPEEIVVAEGPLSVRLIESGTLAPSRAVTYRSPLEGRELEVTFLAPEGLQVQQGDVIARPSRLKLHVDADKNIFVGGEVVELGRGRMTL